MADALQLLRGQTYGEDQPSYQPGQLPMESAPMPQPGPAARPAMAPEPSYAELIAESRGPQSVPMSSSGEYSVPYPSRSDRQPQPAVADTPDYMNDPERKALVSSYERGLRNYKKSVDTRRQKRAQAKEYSKLYHEMDKVRGKADDLRSLMQDFPEAFPEDDSRTLGLMRQRMRHFDTEKRLRAELQQRLQKYGVKFDPKQDLPENPFGDDAEDDRRHDKFIADGFMGALTTPYPQR